MMVETYLRRGQRNLQRWMLDPKIRALTAVAAYGGSGFVLSAAALGEQPQPLAAGLICSATGWRALVISLGAMTGYRFFWGLQGNPGLVWSAAVGLLALLLGKRQETRDQPLMLSALSSFLVTATMLAFWLLLGEKTSLSSWILGPCLTFGAGVLFTQAATCRDSITDWLVSGTLVLALARTIPVNWANPGYAAAAWITVTGAFPAAALAGLGLDLARVTALPMTAVLCAAWLVRLIPFGRKWMGYAVPAFAYLGISAALGIWDPSPLPGLLLGSALGMLAPVRQGPVYRRGETGAAQVRLELGAAVMGTMQQAVLQMEPPPVDQGAILEKARDRACGTCPSRRNCTIRDALTTEMLQDPLEADCEKPGRLIPELHRAQEQLQYLQADRLRRREYRTALMQQYRFLGEFLRHLADQLPRKSQEISVSFRVEASIRSQGKQQVNGDRCLAFPGPGYRYFLLLCDGMGTGLGAAQEGQTAANHLRQMLTAGFPPSHALRCLNSLLVLQGNAGAVTIDLAEIRLDTGLATIYKWGAAPSFLLRRSGAEKIGTATPPPGLSVDNQKETVNKLSLCRGEVLILLSDGLDGEDVFGRLSVTPDAPPGELATVILENGCREAEDDATVAVVRLRPVSSGPS